MKCNQNFYSLLAVVSVFQLCLYFKIFIAVSDNNVRNSSNLAILHFWRDPTLPPSGETSRCHVRGVGGSGVGVGGKGGMASLIL